MLRRWRDPMRILVAVCALTLVSVSVASARNLSSRSGESYVPQLSPSARVKPEAPKQDAKPQAGGQMRPNTPSCTSANSSSPECSAATQQSVPVQTVPFRTR